MREQIRLGACAAAVAAGTVLSVQFWLRASGDEASLGKERLAVPAQHGRVIPGVLPTPRRQHAAVRKVEAQPVPALLAPLFTQLQLPGLESRPLAADTSGRSPLPRRPVPTTPKPKPKPKPEPVATPAAPPARAIAEAAVPPPATPTVQAPAPSVSSRPRPPRTHHRPRHVAPPRRAPKPAPPTTPAPVQAPAASPPASAQKEPPGHSTDHGNGQGHGNGNANANGNGNGNGHANGHGK